MICNQYIKELNINFDYTLLREIALNASAAPNGHKHQRLVSENPYFSKIKEKFPFFSPVYNIYRLAEGQGIPTHIDADRFCALNIPLLNTENSHTNFYNVCYPLITEYDPLRLAHFVKSNASECFRFTLKYPTLINNGDKNIPHGVMHVGPGERVIISWSLLKSINFVEACNIFTEDVVKELSI